MRDVKGGRGEVEERRRKDNAKQRSPRVPAPSSHPGCACISGCERGLRRRAQQRVWRRLDWAAGKQVEKGGGGGRANGTEQEKERKKKKMKREREQEKVELSKRGLSRER